MNALMFYEIMGIVLAVQLFVGLWTRFFPADRIQNPAKSLTARCCYYSDLAAGSKEAWQQAQKLYSSWNLRLMIPSALCSLAAVTLFVLLVKPQAFTLPVTLLFLCCLFVPFYFMLQVRIRTERDLKAWAAGQEKAAESAPAPEPPSEQ